MNRKLFFIALLSHWAIAGCAVPREAESPSPIAVQGAVDSELTPLIEALGNPEPRDIEGYRFWTGTIGDTPAIVSRTEVGMVNAAVATTLLIREFAPKAIINQGTAGAVDPSLEVGDIVLARASTPFGAVRTEARARGEGVSLESWKPLPRFLRVGEDRRAFERFESSRELLETALETTYEHGRLVEGIVGSADQWNREVDKLLWAHERFGIASEDMESASAHQVAQVFGVPFLAVRIISNSEHNDPEFRRELGLVCADFVRALVERLTIESLNAQR
jgi:adenosylhomocysteine nucleosidase